MSDSGEDMPELMSDSGSHDSGSDDSDVDRSSSRTKKTKKKNGKKADTKSTKTKKREAKEKLKVGDGHFSEDPIKALSFYKDAYEVEFPSSNCIQHR